MPSTAEDFIRLARTAAWQEQLDGFSDEAIKQLLKAVTQAQNEIMSQLEHWKDQAPDWSAGRAEALLRELDSLSDGIQAHVIGQIAEMSGHAGSASLDMFGNILSWDGAMPFNAVALTSAQVASLAMETPVGGRLLVDWVQRNFSENLIDGIKREITAGMLVGDSYPKLIDRIADGWDMTRYEATTLARTYVQSANVGAQQAVYQANQDVVKAWRWCATLEIGGPKGGGTCLQCACLDGKEFPIGGGPPIPLHCRCRCVAVPVTKTWKELGVNVEEMEAIKRPWVERPLDIHEGRTIERIREAGLDPQAFYQAEFHAGAFSDLFPKLTEQQQLAVVGPGRLQLLKEGKVSFADLVDPATGRLRLLKRGPEGGWVGLKGFGGPEGMGGLPLGGGPAIMPTMAGPQFIAKTIEEAEKIGLENIKGVNYVSYKGLDVDLANQFNQVLIDLSHRFDTEIPRVSPYSEALKISMRKEIGPLAMDRYGLGFNPDSWQGKQLAFLREWLPTRGTPYDDIKSYLAHEVGHSFTLYAKDIAGKELMEPGNTLIKPLVDNYIKEMGKDRIIAELGRYAATDPHEMVAEIFASYIYNRNKLSELTINLMEDIIKLIRPGIAL